MAKASNLIQMSFQARDSTLKRRIAQGLAFPLSILTEGESAVIKCIRCGRRRTDRLCELGLVPGTRITLIRRIPGHPMIIDVRGSRIALGRGLSRKIFIERV